MSLSFALAGRHPERIHALLELVRPVVDEIVVAVDDRVPEDELGTLEPLADRLVRFEYADPFERVVPWLYGRCSGDWIFRLDDDEAPSRDLLDRLPELAREKRLTHYWLPCRWLFPDAGSFLGEPPWVPDRHLRLVRNDDRFVRFPGVLHVPARAEGPGAWIEPAFYHLALLLHDRDARAEKARQYERARPGVRVAGRALNEAFYLPESRPHARTRAVSERDLPLVRRMLEARPAAGRKPPGALPRAARGEIDAAWPARPLSEEAYRAELEPLTPLSGVAAGDRQALEVRVLNAGTERWPWGKEATPAVRLAYHWLAPDGEAVVYDGLRTPMPLDLGPGESCIVPLTVEAPPRPGPYLLELDLVHEGARWFGAGPRLAVDVVPRRRLALLAHRPPGERPDWDERVAEWLVDCALKEPDREIVVVGPRPAELAERFLHPSAPGPREYLLAGISPGRARARTLVVLAARTLKLLTGRRLPPDAVAFREELRRCEALLVEPVPRPGEMLDLWVQAAAVRTARRLGVPVRVRP